MAWTVLVKSDDCDDVTTFECPFELFQLIYYVNKRERLFRKPEWVVESHRVTGVVITNTLNLYLDNKGYIDQSRFNRVFTNKEDAIEFCLKKNQQSKVKVFETKFMF